MKNLFALFSVFSLLSCGSGGNGVCLVNATHTPGWTYCDSELESQDDCDRYEGDWDADNSCSALGYTKECPGEEGTYRLSSYECN